MLGFRLVSRLCVPSVRSCVVRSSQNPAKTVVRSYRSQSKAQWRTWETVEKPRGMGAISVGQGLVGAAGVAGIGALCFYGMGMSKHVGAIDRAVFWPQYVRDRIKSTYLYFTGSLGMTAVAGYYMVRSPFLERMMTANRWLVLFGSLGAMIGSSIICQSMPYQGLTLDAKHAAWAVHSGVVGTVIAPLLLVGGPLVLRAAVATGVVVGCLSLTAACAPSEKFLSWGGPLSLCLGGMVIASIGGMFLPASSAVGAGIQAAVTYGGLVLFGGFMLYDTQKIIKHAEQKPLYTATPYDPINASMGIYMDTINIFIRILIIMAGNRRK